MTSFRFSAKRVLLTYSQICDDFTKESVLYDLSERIDIMRYTIGEESHTNGGRHIHCVLVFERKLDSRDVSLFDIGCNGHDHHPNIRPIQRGQAHLNRAEEYVTKDDPTPMTNWEAKLTWGEILDTSIDKDEFMRLVRKNYPRDFCLAHKRLEEMALATWKPGSKNTIYQWEPTYDWNPPNVLTTTTLLPNRSIVVIGPAGCGKTTWAKLIAPKPALFCRHLDSLSLIQDEHQSVVFDDLCFRHLPAQTQKFLVDMNDLAEIHIRYKVARISAGVMRIFTANEFPFEVSENHIDAIERRIQRINLY